MKTIEQKIAAKEAELARLKDAARKKETAQKIIVGSVIINEALHDEKVRNYLIKLLTDKVTRKVDLDRLQPLLNHLNSL